MTTIRRILASSAIALVAVVAASANTIITGALTQTYTASAGPTATNFPLPVVTLNVSQFNAATFCDNVTTIDCTLTSIHFTLSDSLSVDYSVTNTNLLNAADFTLTALGDIAIHNAATPSLTYVESTPGTGLGGIPIGTIAAGATRSGTQVFVASDTADYDCSGATCTLTAHTSGNPSSPITSGPFIGAGKVLFAVSGIGAFAFSGGTNTNSETGSASETVGVTYDYSFTQVTTTTPEPMTFALVGFGLVGAALVVRRRTSRS